MSDAAPSRLELLSQWAAERHGLTTGEIDLHLAAGDASFRRYYRLSLPGGATRMLMDAPPEQEDSRPFVTIARRWAAAGLPVPTLHGIDLSRGFLELDDLGDTPLQACFGNEIDAATLIWHEHAMALIHELQNRAGSDALPPFDGDLLGRELDLFPEWCLGEWLGMKTPPGWEALREALIASALDQPVVTVHRDYDAMNLMVQGDALHLIDFQDAVAGPLSYDMVSLLRGRYCRFDASRFANWVEAFRQRAVADGRLPAGVDAAIFLEQAQAMAAQRSLKVLGIFCRLTLRDAKTGYLERLPHFLGHLDDSLAGLEGHAAFKAWLVETFRPALMARLEGTT
ncbi:aminoglycoside phosphotransferase family protein [Halomonas sp. HK25]|uniref:aminoglycoside phosphotransferase family protein n=1 Tax=Halomonas sp. HK25 TaxID=3394321 RepID=UPI0039FB9401